MKSLEQACHPLFKTLSGLASRESVTRDELLGELKVKLDQMQVHARELGCPSEDIQDACYAMVALVDERVPLDRKELTTTWRNALQQLCYSENTAGEGFYIKLNQLLASKDRHRAARIYALCLAFGFKGVYRDKEPVELSRLRIGVRRYLGLPSKTLPLNFKEKPTRIPTSKPYNPYVLIWSAAGIICVGILGTAIVRKQLDKKTHRLMQDLATLPVVQLAK